MRDSLSFPAALLCGLGLLVGCGQGGQDYPDTPKVDVTKTQQVRRTLEEYANTGVLTSAAQTLPDEIAALKGEGVANADELKNEAESLISAKTPAEVKKQANAMLAKLPPAAPATAAPAGS